MTNKELKEMEALLIKSLKEEVKDIPYQLYLAKCRKADKKE